MGCRPSRHASGRVADSSWGYDRDAYFHNGSKKKKKGKSDSAGHKPTEFSAFSSTSKTYQRISRNISQCSKITLRLSTDGSTLEIEKYDIDFHSSKVPVCAQDKEWCSQDKSYGNLDGYTDRRMRFSRCESAPQLAYLPGYLNTIAENGGAEGGSQISSKGKKHGNSYYGSRHLQLRHSETFANHSTVNNHMKMELDTSIRLADDRETCHTNANVNVCISSRQTEVSSFDLESNNEHGCISSDKQTSSSKQTPFEKDDIESTLINAPNSKSINHRKNLIGKTTHTNCKRCNSKREISCCSHINNEMSSEKAGATETQISDTKSDSVVSCSSPCSNKRAPISDLRAEIYNSINKFDEIIFRRQESKKNITLENIDSGSSNRTLVSIHPTPCPQNSVLLVKGVGEEDLDTENQLNVKEVQNHVSPNTSCDSVSVTRVNAPPTQQPSGPDRTCISNAEHNSVSVDVDNNQILSSCQACTKTGCAGITIINGTKAWQTNFCAKNKGAINTVNGEGRITVEMKDASNKASQTCRGDIQDIDAKIYNVVHITRGEQHDQCSCPDCGLNSISQSFILKSNRENKGTYAPDPFLILFYFII